MESLCSINVYNADHLRVAMILTPSCHAVARRLTDLEPRLCIIRIERAGYLPSTATTHMTHLSAVLLYRRLYRPPR